MRGIPSELLESELFGHIRGAFTGAYESRDGKFVAAHGGTIFFDEIGDMPLHMQVKIFRAIEEKEVTPVGSNIPVPVDVRVVAATDKDIGEEVQKGRFREELYYRLNVFPLCIPSLRERREDIPYLADYFVKELNREYRASIRGLTSGALQFLQDHEWNGNVRELRNALESAFVLKEKGYIEVEDLRVSAKEHEGIARHDSAETGSSAVPRVEIQYKNRLLETRGGKVLPMRPRTLADKDGAYSKDILRQRFKEKAAYVETLPDAQQSVAYLDAQNAALLFRHQRGEYHAILQKIEEEGQDEDIPFAVFYPLMMARMPELNKINPILLWGFISGHSSIYVLEGLEGTKRTELFVINENNYRDVIRFAHDAANETEVSVDEIERRMESFREKLAGRHARYHAWKAESRRYMQASAAGS